MVVSCRAGSSSGPKVRMRPFFILAILVCGIVGHAPAQSDAAAATGTKIASLERLWDQALKARDTRALDSILSDNVLLVNYDGSVQTKGDFLTSTKKRFSQPTALQPEFTVQFIDVHVFGTMAIATGVYQVKGIEQGKPYSRRERFLDTWKFKNGMWLIAGTQATPVLH